MPKKRGIISTFFRKLFFLLFFMFLLAVAGTAVWGYFYVDEMVSHLPTEEEMLAHKTSMASVVYDREGEIITKLYLENRTPVVFKEISPWMIKATLAAEDDSFYKHSGMNYKTILRALYVDILHQDVKQGGSTITQQLARTLFLSNDRTIERKIKELIIALRLERMFSKDKILEMYLNSIYLGHGSWGIYTASHTYFGKKPSELDLAEASVIAGLIAAPERYSPLKNLEAAKSRQKYVLDRLLTLGWISEEEAEKTYNKDLALKSTEGEQKNYNHAPYFVSEILFSHLLPRYGKEKVYRGGMEIHTTLDLDLQRKAQEAIRTLDTEGALVAIDSTTGEILALVGGKNFEKSKFNRAVQAYRQPGSAFKPFVYSAAYEQGILPVDHILDEELSFEHQGPNDETWSPGNYSGKYHGEVTILKALTHSYNTVSVRTAQMIGIGPVLSLARRAGLTSPHIPHDLSAALGSSNITPLELARGYCIFANNGYRIDPLYISRIEDSSGAILEESSSYSEKAISAENAVVMRSMLLNVVNAGTGRKCRIPGYEVFGKTGTTNEFRDAWFAGGVPGLVTVVYAGRDNHKTIGGRATGGTVAGPVWKQFMDFAVEHLSPPRSFNIPSGLDLETFTVCSETGYLATGECPSTNIYLPYAKAPSSFCPLHGGDRYAASKDSNAPKTLLLPDDVEIYENLEAEKLLAETPAGTEQAQIPVMSVQKPGEEVPSPDQSGGFTDPYDEDPSPAEDYESKYNKLLEQYGISD